MYGTWLGLTEVPGSSAEWQWSDGTKESVKDIQFNAGVTYYGGSNYVGGGKCGMAAMTTISQWNTGDETYRVGFYAGDCGTSATAICMKQISS